MKEPTFEIERRYTLRDSDIIPCDADSEIRRKKEEYFKGMLAEGIEWPVEWLERGMISSKPQQSSAGLARGIYLNCGEFVL